jgi:hypothetical protein
MGSYVAFLRALRGLFAADEVVTRRGFRAFVNAA